MDRFIPFVYGQFNQLFKQLYGMVNRLSLSTFWTLQTKSICRKQRKLRGIWGAKEKLGGLLGIFFPLFSVYLWSKVVVSR